MPGSFGDRGPIMHTARWNSLVSPVPGNTPVWVLVADYGCEGLRLYGVYSTEEKAKAAGFDANLHGSGGIIMVEVDYPPEERRS